jgi:N-acetylmuramoyl-L-alanine amidase
MKKIRKTFIALKIQQSKYLESSLIFGSFVEDNFVNKDKRFSRGVKQQNLHVLRRNAMPSVLIELGFISNYEEAKYMASDSNQNQMAESIYNSILSYKKKLDRNVKEVEPPKPVEMPLKNDFRILVMSTATKYKDGDAAFKGLKYILPIKEGSIYKYYYGVTNYASVRDQNIKTAKDAGFRNAYSVSFVPNQAVAQGYYTIEVAAEKERLSRDSAIFTILKDVERERIDGIHYYTYGNVKTLEEAIKLQKQIEDKGIKNTIIQKVFK